ncbi:MAG: hypothetical protein HY983_01790 [Candidatus Magasanikbacteria bacterium]|nr:hypothetical protein [Candidatus Magasanikbacteria bacterium]
MAQTGTARKSRLERVQRELVKDYEGILKRLTVLRKKRAALHKEILAALDRAKVQGVLKKIKRLR